MEDYKKKYFDAIERLKQWNQEHQNGYVTEDKDKFIFPELKESEDERIWIINYLSNRELNSSIIAEKENLKKAIAWLERQAQKSADKVEPKFHKGCIVISNKNTDCVNSIMSITSIRNGEYLCAYKNGQMSYRFNHIEDNYHLLTLKEVINLWNPVAWSEEDEKFVHGLIRGLAAKRDIHGRTTFSSDCIDITETINWLKSLRPQNTWKPSDEQMEALNDVISSRDIKYDVLSELWDDLEKLKK